MLLLEVESLLVHRKAAKAKRGLRTFGRGEAGGGSGPLPPTSRPRPDPRPEPSRIPAAFGSSRSSRNSRPRDADAQGVLGQDLVLRSPTFVRGRIAAGGRTLQNIASQLLDNCLAVDPKLTRGIGGDNMTAIIVQFEHQA